MTMCKLCEMLNDRELPRKVYKDIKHWWYEEGKCKTASQLPPIALDGNQF